MKYRCGLFVSLILTALMLVATPIRTKGAEPPSEPAANSDESDDGALHILPERVALEGHFARSQLLVQHPDPATRDLTGQATFRSSEESIARVTDKGMVSAVGDGETQILVEVEGQQREVPVVVSGLESDPQIDFTTHLRPILNKAGCAGAACHASQHGKGGFKLSVFGFDPQADYEAIVRDRLQRRVSLVDPENSLVLLKPTMQVPHGGGKRLQPGSVEYRMFAAWIAAGSPPPAKEPAELAALHVTPSDRIAREGWTQQLKVEAVYTDGRRQDVTALALFDSMDDSMLQVDEGGLVRVTGRGQAPIMVRFEGQTAVSTFLVPYSDQVELTNWENQNFIDELAVAKFRQLGLEPSPVCDDATFIRRAFLDAIGTLPTKQELVAFLEDSDSDKRAKLVDRLLGLTGDPEQDIYNDAYAAYWTLKWSDLIRNNSNSVGEQGMWALHNWIRESFRVNRPFDEFVKELVTAKGSIYSNGPANYFRIHGNSSELTEATAQLFLGIRLECAKCHHHPFEKYSQADYYGFAAYFSRVGSKNSEEFGLFGRETVVLVKSSGDVKHPRTGKILAPTPLEGETPDDPLDRRLPLAEWLTSPENDDFSKSVVNRYVAYLLGRGLVDPVDDMRSTNPPTNAPLMDALAKDLVDSGYDLKHLIRTVMTSRLYQLDSQPTEANRADDRFYSHFRVKRLTAEPLLDAIDDATGTPTKFKNLPAGTRAIELPDAEYPNYFLNTFAKPRRASVCECERSPDENLAQALHTLNGDTIADKISDKNGRLAKLLADEKPPAEMIAEIYLATLSRPPSDAELASAQEFLEQSPDTKTFYEDLLWALLNSKHFLFIH